MELSYFVKYVAFCHSPVVEGIPRIAPNHWWGLSILSTHLNIGLDYSHGLKGPLQIKELYDNGHQMAASQYNKNLSDKDISDIISYSYQ